MKTVVNSALDFKLLAPVVSKAKTWGFICQRQSANGWLINGLITDEAAAESILQIV